MSLIHICQICDKNTLALLNGAWKAITMNNPDHHFMFHLIHSIEDAQVLSNFEERFRSFYPKVNIMLYYTEETGMLNKNDISCVNKKGSLIFYIPAKLSNIEKVLYLNIDTLITGDIEPIWKLDCGEIGLCIKSSIHPIWKEKNGHRCGNVGVMLMNLATLRNNNFTKRVVDIFLEKPEDAQSIINTYAEGKYIDLSGDMNIFQNQDDDKYKDPIIYSLVGNKKPWNSLEKNLLFDLWHSYNKISTPNFRPNISKTGIGVLIYDTKNIGDWTQTAAALYIWWIHFERPNTFKSFVEHCVEKSEMGSYPITWVNRDRISTYKKPDNIDNLIIICNAWWMHKFNNHFCFITQEWIKPIYISVHFSKIEILSENVIKHLKRYQPIGCRDISTKNLLDSKGIDTYFSGCLTMTLNLRDSKLGFTLANDYRDKKIDIDYNKKEAPNFIKLTQMTQVINDTSCLVNNIQRCFDLLFSDKIITTRLHVWLPLVCNNTNVVLMNKKTNKEFKNGDPDNQNQKINRFNGIIDTINDKPNLKAFKCLLLNRTLYEINKYWNQLSTV